LLQFGHIPDEPLLDGFNVRAVIADKYHQKAIWPFALVQCPNLPVYAWQREVNGWLAEFTEGSFGSNHEIYSELVKIT
jgi:hypothetical protein